MAKTYYFALGDVLRDLKLSQAEARRRFKMDKPGQFYISKNGFSILCNRPDRVTVRVFGIVCNAMKLDPSHFWRVAK